MYITRPLSLYRKSSSARFIRPPEPPYSGYVVITDEESEEQDASCCGMCKNDKVQCLPFPQDKILKVIHLSDHQQTSVIRAWFIPVLDKPLSSNRYYVIKAEGRDRGQACICSPEEEMSRCCCLTSTIMDIETRPFNHRDIYQQVEIHRYHMGGFYAESVSQNSYAPMFLRKKGWQVQISNSFKHRLRDAPGLDPSLLLNQPESDGPRSSLHSNPNILAKWYCPFIFVKEKCKLQEQMKKTLFYHLNLEQWWEKIHSCENSSEGNNNRTVTIKASLKREVSIVYGMDATKDDKRDADGLIWFRIKEVSDGKRRFGVGLSSAIVEKMRWLLEKGGWIDKGNQRDIVRVKKEVEMENEIGWQRLSCYVLVWTFVLKRMDGSPVLNYNIRNIDRLGCRWE